jgi:hypothetical protein
VNIPNDLSDFEVAALIEDGAGGYTVIDGQGNADGTFVIDAVPDGTYWLRVPAPERAAAPGGADGGIGLYRTEASAVDAGYTQQGRSDAVPYTTPTELVLDVTGLAPWQDGDQVELFSTEAAAWYFIAQDFASAGQPAIDDEALVGFTFDLSQDYSGSPHLIDGGRTPPDRLVVAQLSTSLATGGFPYQAMARLFEPAPFTVVDGQTVNLSGEFTNVSIDQPITLDLRLDAVREAMTEETRPCELPPVLEYGWGVYVLGVAGGLGHGIYGATADFLALDVPRDQPDVVAGDMGYGMPLVGTWGIYGDARFFDPCSYMLPGAASPTVMWYGNGMTIAEPIDTFGNGALAPRLGQVRGPTIEGSDLFSEQNGFGLTPTLSWMPPSIGTPSFYVIAIHRLFLDGGGATSQEYVADLTTDQTSVTLPPGILQVGEAYVLGIVARVSSRPDPAAFNRESLPEYHSTVLSAIQRP